MEGILMDERDPFRQGLRSTAHQGRVAEHVKRLREDADARAEECRRYELWMRLFLRCEQESTLWASDPLEIERYLLALQEYARIMTPEEFPELYAAILTLTAIAQRSASIRQRFLPGEKAITLPATAKAPH